MKTQKGWPTVLLAVSFLILASSVLITHFVPAQNQPKTVPTPTSYPTYQFTDYVPSEDLKVLTYQYGPQSERDKIQWGDCSVSQIEGENWELRCPLDWIIFQDSRTGNLIKVSYINDRYVAEAAQLVNEQRYNYSSCYGWGPWRSCTPIYVNWPTVKTLGLVTDQETALGEAKGITPFEWIVELRCNKFSCRLH